MYYNILYFILHVVIEMLPGIGLLKIGGRILSFHDYGKTRSSSVLTNPISQPQYAVHLISLVLCT